MHDNKYNAIWIFVKFIIICLYTTVSLFVHLYNKNVILSSVTIQVNEAITQNTSDSPLSTLYLIQRNLSLDFSLLICSLHSSHGTECSLKPSTFHYIHEHNLNLFTDKYNFEEYFAMEFEPVFARSMSML